MPLVKTPVSIPIASGLDEGTDARLSATMTQLSNGVYTHTGAIDKRLGTSTLGTYTSASIGQSVAAPPPAQNLAPLNNELIRLGNTSLHTWSPPPPNGAGIWVCQAQTSPLTMTRSTPLVSSASTASTFTDGTVSIVTYFDVAYANGYTVYAGIQDLATFESGTRTDVLSCVITVVDSTGTTVLSASPVGYNPLYSQALKLCALGTYVFLVFIDYTVYDPDIAPITFLARFNTSTLTVDVTETYTTYPIISMSYPYGYEIGTTAGITFDFVALDTELALVGASAYNSSTAMSTVSVYYFSTALAYLSTTSYTDNNQYYSSFCAAPHYDGTNSFFLLYSGFEPGSPSLFFSHITSGTVDTEPVNISVMSSEYSNITGAVYPSAPNSAFGSPQCAFISDCYYYNDGAQTNNTQTFYYGLLTKTAVAYSSARSIHLQSGLFAEGGEAALVDTFVMGLTSRAWIAEGKAYVAIAQVGETNIAALAAQGYSTLPTQPTMYIVALNVESTITSLFPLSIVGTSAPREFQGTFNTCSRGLAKISATSFTVLGGPNPAFETFSVSYPCNQICEELDGELFIASGAPSYFDGQSNAEIGFFQYPYDLYISVYNIGPAGPLTGTYSYVAVYRWTSADGLIERSAPSTPASFVASDNNLQITVPCLPFSNKTGYLGTGINYVYIEIYRTVANGSIYYLVNDLDTVSTYSAATVTIVDAVSDALLQTGAQLYSTAQLDNVNPPSASYVHTIAQEIWLVGTDDDTIWYTPGAVGDQAPIWNEGFTIQPFAGGRCVAMSDMDGTRYVFKSDSIWAITGYVPNLEGTNGTISQPIRVSANDGCIEPRSIVVTQEGIYFLSRRGICRLSRSVNVEFVGNPVIGETTGVSITGAVLDNLNSRVLFPAPITGGMTGKVLSYDYRVGSWTTLLYSSATGTAGQYCPVAVCAWQGRFTFVDARGQAATESPGNYLDEGTVWVPMSMTYPETHALGIEGFQLVYRAGILQRSDSAHGFTLSIAYDYNTSYAVNVTYSDTQVSAMTLEEIMLHIARKCRSLRIAYTDAAPTVAALGTGKGPSITGLTLELGAKQTLNRLLPAAQR